MSDYDWNAADTLQRKLREPGIDTLRYKTALAFTKHDVAKQDAYVAAYQKSGRSPVFTASLLDYAEEPAGADRLLALDVKTAKSTPDRRVVEAVYLAKAAIERGHVRKAFDLLQNQPAASTLTQQVLYASLPFVNLSQAQLLAIRAELLKSDSTPAPEVMQLRPQFRLYHLAVISCQLGRTDDALQYARRLEALPTPAYWQPGLHNLATDVRTLVDIKLHRPADALAKMRSVHDYPPGDLWGTPANRDVMMMWKGDLLAAAGQLDDALAWFENGGMSFDPATPQVAYFLLRRAEIIDQKGDVKAAAPMYARALKFWNDVDPEFQPLVDRARTRLAAIQRRVD